MLGMPNPVACGVELLPPLGSAAIGTDSQGAYMPVCHLSFNWDSPSTGTGPFKTGFDYEVPGGSGDQEDVADAVKLWWNGASTFRGYFYAALATGTVTSVGEFGGSVIEYDAGTISLATGLAPDLPGCSMRAIKTASRPAGGRRGSMFWPLLEGTAYDSDGIISGTPLSDLSAGVEAMRAAVEAAVVGAVIVQKHVVSGVETTNQVTAMHCAPTVSFLQRRYR